MLTLTTKNAKATQR